jgi:death-on-curing protein
VNVLIWITPAVIHAVQEELLARFGGLAGIRDEGLLESALARPQQLHAYGKSSIFDLAASYTQGIVKNHPFLEGNKRAGFMAAYIFLGANGQELQAPEEDALVFTVGLAAGEVSESEYAAWLKSSCGKKPALPKKKKQKKKTTARKS